MTDNEDKNLQPKDSQDDDQNSGLPEWIELIHPEKESKQIIEENNSEDPVQPPSTGQATGWQLENLEEVDDSTLPIHPPEDQHPDPKTLINPDAKADATKPVLPRWLENVVDAEELKDTSKLTLNKKLAARETNLLSPPTTPESSPGSAVDLLSSISNNDLLSSDTQPTFIQVISKPQATSPEISADQNFPDLVQLLKEKQIAQSYKHGQGLLLKDENLALLIDYLVDWLQQNPDVAEIWHLLGDTYMRNNQPSKAIRAFSEASRLLSK